MDSFAKLMCTIGASNSKVDFVASLPREIAELILRRLDPRTLLNVARVSGKWMAVCKADSQLRKTARRHLRKDKQSIMQGRRSASKLNKIKKQVASSATSMQTKLAQIRLVFPTSNAKRPALKNRSSDYDRHGSMIPTKSSLRLR